MQRAELKQMLRDKKIKQYRLAEQLGYTETRFCVILRKPISTELEGNIRKAVKVLEND